MALRAYILVFSKLFIHGQSCFHTTEYNFFTMDLILIIAIILLIGWALGFFAFSATGFIHILLIAAVIIILLRLIRGR